MKINQHKRAGIGWNILIETAKNRELISYSELGDGIGIHHRTVRYVLGLIQEYCLNHELPPLTILVVNEKRRTPGSGFIAWDVDDIDNGLNQVYEFNWSNYPNPFEFAIIGTTEEEIIDELISDPDNSDDVYTRVRSRGTAQVIFRKALLKAYNSKCSFCGSTFEFLLEASHIIPWSEASRQQRLDVRNGILLCANHHKLFDRKQIIVQKDYTLKYVDYDQLEFEHQIADKIMTIEIHGKNMNLPNDKKLHPNLDYLKEHRK